MVVPISELLQLHEALPDSPPVTPLPPTCVWGLRFLLPAPTFATVTLYFCHLMNIIVYHCFILNFLDYLVRLGVFP